MILRDVADRIGGEALDFDRLIPHMREGHRSNAGLNRRVCGPDCDLQHEEGGDGPGARAGIAAVWNDEVFCRLTKP